MLKIFFATLLPLIILDGFWLMVVAKTFYAERIGHLMATQPTWWPVLVFYPMYAFALTYFVVHPLEGTPLGKVALTGALFGFIAYATYDLTNHATLKNWPLSMTIVDVLWGTAVGAIVCVIAAALTKN